MLLKLFLFVVVVVVNNENKNLKNVESVCVTESIIKSMVTIHSKNRPRNQVKIISHNFLLMIHHPIFTP